jgi:hypothetical protein
MKKALFELALGLAMMSEGMTHPTQTRSCPSPVMKSTMSRKDYQKRKKRLAMAKQSRRINRKP